jgi:hypothetical protein
MLGLVQIIVTTWSKEFRGGAGAVARNRVPEAESLPLPVPRLDEPAYLVHTVSHSFGSVRRPGPTLAVQPADEPLRAGCLTVNWEQDRLSVDVEWMRGAGKPYRYPRQGVLQLAPGQWGRLRYNARMSPPWESEWWYERWVSNVGFFSALDPRVFMETGPVKVHSEMAQLW